MKINFVTAIHGDEPAPTLALASMGIKQIVGNPLALERRVRFVDKDLNASFGLEGNLYEVRRAKQLINQLREDETVIDLHTFTGESPPYVIIVDKDQLPLASVLGIQRVVFMAFNPKRGHALINYRRGISVELGQHEDFSTVFENVRRIVRNLKVRQKKQIELYEVIGKYTQKGNYKNFKQYKDGYFPLLASDRAYQIHGWYALKAREVKLNEFFTPRVFYIYLNYK